MSATATHKEEGRHPDIPTYLRIATILTLITLIEVAIYYMPFLRGVLVPLLLIFSAAKFVLVVAFYMHLKFDATIYSRLFFGPLTIAALMIIALMLLFGHFFGRVTT
jgi:cytochrome c oxidase subunit 4